MAQILQSILEWVKLQPRYLLGICIVSGLLLFGADSWFISTIGLSELANEYKPLVAFVFLTSLCLLIATLIIEVWMAFKKKYSESAELKIWKSYMKKLSDDEKRVLRLYIESNTKTRNFELENGTVQGLVHMRILYRSSSFGRAFSGFPYNIQPWAWTYLNDNKQLLKIEGEEEWTK